MKNPIRAIAKVLIGTLPLDTDFWLYHLYPEGLSPWVTYAREDSSFNKTQKVATLIATN